MIRIRTNKLRIRMRIKEATKHADPTDPDANPEHRWIQGEKRRFKDKFRILCFILKQARQIKFTDPAKSSLQCLVYYGMIH